MYYITETQPRFRRMLEKWLVLTTEIPLTTKVGDAVGTTDITAMWQAHFSELLNSVHDTSSKSFVCEHVVAVLPDSRILVTSCDVSDSLKKVRLGNSAGLMI